MDSTHWFKWLHKPFTRAIYFPRGHLWVELTCFFIMTAVFFPDTCQTAGPRALWPGHHVPGACPQGDAGAEGVAESRCPKGGRRAANRFFPTTLFFGGQGHEQLGNMGVPSRPFFTGSIIFAMPSILPQDPIVFHSARLRPALLPKSMVYSGIQ